MIWEHFLQFSSQNFLVIQEFTNGAVVLHHLAQGWHHTSELTLSLVLLIQEITSQVVHQLKPQKSVLRLKPRSSMNGDICGTNTYMVVIELAFTGVFTNRHNVTDLVGNLTLKLESILQSTDSVFPQVILRALKYTVAGVKTNVGKYSRLRYIQGEILPDPWWGHQCLWWADHASTGTQSV